MNILLMLRNILIVAPPALDGLDLRILGFDIRLCQVSQRLVDNVNMIYFSQ